MSENSKIEWTDHTFNPWIGCTRVSPGCDHCYAAVSTPARAMHVAWGANESRHRTAPSTWKDPLKWNARHAEFFEKHGRRQRVFCASLADVFDNAVDPQWRADLFHLIEQTPNLDWLLLTKRIGNAEKMIREARLSLVGSTRLLVPYVLPNVWLGATICNQEEADRDIPKLLMTPARVRFLSMEPLLGPVDLQAWFDPTGMCCGQEMTSCEDCPASAEWIHGPTTEYAEDGSGYSSPSIDWVITGGESGHHARHIHPDWPRQLRDQCAAGGVPYLFKQWGEWHTAAIMGSTGDAVFRQFDDFQQWVNKAQTWVNGGICLDRHGRELKIGADFMRARDNGDFPVTIMHRVGKKAAGRMLDGRTHDEFPKA